jgi:flavin-dependent dehydrogenase
MSERFDAAVVGGGPAGATVALCLARRGWKVCLFETTAFDTERYGETLPPEINPLLRELKLSDEFRALAPLESPGIVSVWGGPPQEHDYLRNPHGTGWHVDRNRFDAMLCRQAVAAGAVSFERCRAHAGQRDAGWWRVGEIRAGVLVDAAGRNGLRTGPDARRESEDRLLAIVLRLTHPCGRPPDLRTYVESAPAGWWYSAPLPQGETIAMFFTDCGLYTRQGVVLHEQLRQAPLTRSRLLDAEVAGTRTVYAASSCRRKIAGEAWLTVGDSAASYDPLSGMGIFKALRQGTNAAIAVDGYLQGDAALLTQYAALVREEFDAYVRRRRAHYAEEQRWVDHEFWNKRRELTTSSSLQPVG